jgi:mRNA interferase RelE/StbE
MDSFKLRWLPVTKKQLRQLPGKELVRIIEKINALPIDPIPHGSVKLVDTDHSYRIRIGDYRVVYEIFYREKVIEIQRVRHRRDVYKN